MQPLSPQRSTTDETSPPASDSSEESNLDHFPRNSARVIPPRNIQDMHRFRSAPTIQAVSTSFEGNDTDSRSLYDFPSPVIAADQLYNVPRSHSPHPGTTRLTNVAEAQKTYDVPRSHLKSASPPVPHPTYDVPPSVSVPMLYDVPKEVSTMELYDIPKSLAVSSSSNYQSPRGISREEMSNSSSRVRPYETIEDDFNRSPITTHRLRPSRSLESLACRRVLPAQSGSVSHELSPSHLYIDIDRSHSSSEKVEENVYAEIPEDLHGATHYSSPRAQRPYSEVRSSADNHLQNVYSVVSSEHQGHVPAAYTLGRPGRGGKLVSGGYDLCAPVQHGLVTLHRPQVSPPRNIPRRDRTGSTDSSRPYQTAKVVSSSYDVSKQDSSPPSSTRAASLVDDTNISDEYVMVTRQSLQNPSEDNTAAIAAKGPVHEDEYQVMRPAQINRSGMHGGLPAHPSCDSDVKVSNFEAADDMMGYHHPTSESTAVPHKNGLEHATTPSDPLPITQPKLVKVASGSPHDTSTSAKLRYE